MSPLLSICARALFEAAYEAEASRDEGAGSACVELIRFCAKGAPEVME